MNRIHELDALRAAAMLLVVVVHALCFLMPFSDFWPGKHVFAEETQPLYNPYVYVFSALAGFLMPLFFMLSGYFTAMQWRRRGLAQMVMARAKHVGLPLLLAMVTVIPLTHWVFTGGENNSITWPEHFYHLWFLWYLLLIVGAFGLAAKLGLRFRHRLWWLLVPAPVVPQYFMRQIVGADVPGGFLPELSIFAYYLVFFLAGVLLHQRSVPVRRCESVLIAPILPYTYGQYLFGGIRSVEQASRQAPAFRPASRSVSKQDRHILSEAAPWELRSPAFSPAFSSQLPAAARRASPSSWAEPWSTRRSSGSAGTPPSRPSGSPTRA